MNEQSPPSPTQDSPEAKKPWPMSRVILAIAVFVFGYTLIMAFFRKEEEPYFPYEEAQAEALNPILIANGWQPLPNAYTVRDLPNINSEDEVALRQLQTYIAEETIGIELGEQSPTPLHMEGVLAPGWIASREPYHAEIQWLMKEEKAYPDKLNFYLRDREILILPPFGRIRPDETAEPRTAFLIPPEVLRSGEYTLYVYSKGGLVGWTLTVE